MQQAATGEHCISATHWQHRGHAASINRSSLTLSVAPLVVPPQGPNLLKLARKEQCLALLTQLRTKFKIDGYIYRVFPNGEVQYLHPKVRAERRGGGGAGFSCAAGLAGVTADVKLGCGAVEQHVQVAC